MELPFARSNQNTAVTSGAVQGLSLLGLAETAKGLTEGSYGRPPKHIQKPHGPRKCLQRIGWLRNQCLASLLKRSVKRPGIESRGG